MNHPEKKHPWGHPKYFFQPLEGVVEEKVLEEFKRHITIDEKGEKVDQLIREKFFKDHVKPKILEELQKTKCFFRRQAQYDLGNPNMPNCIDFDEQKCGEYYHACESNEIVDITLIGDSFKNKPVEIKAEKWEKIQEALTQTPDDINILRSKYRKSLVWSPEWFRAENGVGEVTGWHKESGLPPMNAVAAARMKAETDLYLDGKLSTSQLTQGLPEIHLDTFVLPLKDYIELGYGAKLGPDNYQGHTLNFWMPLGKMTAPLGFVTNEQDKFEVGNFNDKVGSGWLFDTAFKKHTMISVIEGPNDREELRKNNRRQSLEFRFDLHFKKEPANSSYSRS